MNRVKNILAIITITLISQNLFAQNEAPDFTVLDTKGKTHNLYSYLDSNKLVVLDFYFTECSFCQYYAPLVNQSYLDFGCNKGDVFFLGIDYGDSIHSIEQFEQTYGIQYPSASGLEGNGDSVVSLYNITGFPTLLIIGTNKKILKKITSPTTALLDTLLVKMGATMQACNLSVEEIDRNIFTIYPNPVQDQLTVTNSLIENEPFTLSIYDLSGQLVFHKNYKSQQQSIKLNHLENGLYLLKLVSGNQSFTKKIIIQ